MALKWRIRWFLRKIDVNIRGWGKTGRSKSLDSLVNALCDGEIIWDFANGSKTLEYNVAVVYVLYEEKGIEYELREKYRLFRNGIVDPRRFDGSLAEKIKIADGETAKKAAERGLSEELSGSKELFKDPRNYNLREWRREDLGPSDSKSYPGLLSLYHRNIFKCSINNRLFQAEYVERQPDKETHFSWIQVMTPVEKVSLHSAS
jgi:hypothetical protein